MGMQTGPIMSLRMAFVVQCGTDMACDLAHMYASFICPRRPKIGQKVGLSPFGPLIDLGQLRTL